VSWHIYSGDLGSAARQDDFRADASLPSTWYKPGSTSYSGSGFDRGHNCPSADRTLTTTANSSTFLMSNMIPQAPTNNQQTWNNMESYIRSLVPAGNEVYVIMGSYGMGGTGSNGTYNTIDAGRITVPNRVWKVVVVIPNGNGDLSRVTTSTRVIAVNTPNTNSISTDWKTYRTSVDAIEAATGYNLLSNVSSTIQSVIESVVDNQ
jgi:endonuclease G